MRDFLAAFSSPTKWAVALAALGFFISFSTTSTRSINGVATCTHYDYAAIVLGGLTLLIASIGEVRALQSNENRVLNLSASGGSFLIGGYHLARGLGLIGGPCAGL